MASSLKNPLLRPLLVVAAVSVPALLNSALSATPQASPADPPSVADEMLDTPDIVPEAVPEPPLPVTAPVAEPTPEPVQAQDSAVKLQALAQGAYTPPIGPEPGIGLASDIPNLMAPFSEISAFSLGHTVPGSKWRLFPHFSVTGIFDDNVYLSSDNKVSDFYFALSPGLGATYGSDDSTLRFQADYTASFLVFMKESSQDTVDQNAAVHVTYALPKLTLGLTLSFQSLNGASVDVGDRVRRQIFYIGVTSNYVLDEKFSFDFNVDDTGADYHDLNDSNEARIQTWLNYQATGKTNVGLGLTLGDLSVQNATNQTYEQLLARVKYDATGKLSLYASGGVELRQADTEKVSPVFAIGAVYSPTATTTISLDFHERIYPSAALDGQDYRATGFMLTVTQQLRQNLSAILTAGYENTKYFAVDEDIFSDRVDHYTYVRVGPDWQVRPWWHLGAFYEFSRNASSGEDSRSFTRNRVGLQANFAF